MTEVKPNYFDKVLVLAEVARLESLLDFERTAKEQALQQNASLAEHLRGQAQKTAKALNFNVDKIPLLVQSVRPWISEKNRDAFDQLAADPGFEPALRLGVKALIAEALS